MSRPFEYCWEFMEYACRAYEAEPGIIRYYELPPGRDGDPICEREVEHPRGLANEIVSLVLDARRMRCELAAAGAGPASCSECDYYDSEDIAACPHCHKPVCDGCMHNWHINGICCPEG